MPHELRVPGRAPVRFDTEELAVAAARHVLQEDPDAEPEVIDVETGKASAPGSSKGWREELKGRVGF